MMRFGFIFPGQGSQIVGMLSDVAEVWPIIKETFREASDILGYDLWALSQYGPAMELSKTWKTQPVMLTASFALWRVWCQQGGKRPVLLAGHSLGEYSALVCSEAITFFDAIGLVQLRGKFMQEAVPEGAGSMSAIIGLDDESIIQACTQSAEGQIVSLANFNSPGQVVIAGHKEAVKRASIACKAAGAKYVLPLPVSVPAHCALMKSAADKLSAVLEKITFNTPKIPIVNSIDVKCETTPKAIRSMLIRQIYSPVQWYKTIEFMVASYGIKHLYEIGPGRVLTNLIKQQTITILSASALNKPDAILTALALTQ